jgi:hypothetical protein
MGEITYIRAGQATTIYDDGSTSSKPVDKCDSCGEWVDVYGGFKVRDVGLEVVIWLCAQCRA